MAIEIRGLPASTALHARVTKQLTAALARLTVEPVTALVVFSDENGPKGGRAMRCAMTLRLPYRAPVHVDILAEAPRGAFEEAFAALERQLERYRERARDERRHPKKYYAAKRLQ